MLSVISVLSCECQSLPRSYWIESKAVALPNEPYTSGTCAGVYHGTQNGESVAVKVLRTSSQESKTKLVEVSEMSSKRNAYTRADL